MAKFFIGQVLPEPHSTKQIDDCVGWALETTPEAMIASQGASHLEAGTAELAKRVNCPSLVVHGPESRA